eukprot:gnl/Dysnectes_brevis/2878_a3516_819.p1 GENE.gnl/Dysnectes_brevis/2878_a3516_819~~gnl/Dysnectes_brevis/2878_a3516_819.p1  ORF type:complete len:372 (+),score=71.71 gnl/Dysnectes_brevis/2878_a3516_819:93-1118(+)
MTSFDDLTFTVYEGKKTTFGEMVCRLLPSPDPSAHPRQKHLRSFVPDRILVRSVIKALGSHDSTSKALGIAFSGIPCVNSISSQLLMLHRPYMMGLLRKINKEHGQEVFPIIPDLHFFPAASDMVITPSPPAVGKAGHAHASHGKMLCEDSRQTADFKSLVALCGTYCTMERYIPRDVDLRVQKIGEHVRLLSRRSQNWKGNTGPALLEHIYPVPERYIRMIELAAAPLGLGICSLDLVVDADGNEYILELNDTATGLANDFRDEDNDRIARLTLGVPVEDVVPDEAVDVHLPAPRPTVEAVDKPGEKNRSSGSNHHVLWVLLGIFMMILGAFVQWTISKL